MAERKNLIISKLEKLQNIYKQDESKKYNLRALNIAINGIKKYDGNILSGEQLKNEIKGVGDKISKRIDEIIKTGDLHELSEYNNVPNVDNNTINLENLLLITGVGDVRAKKWLEMGIKNINDVKEAIKENKIKTTHHIDIGIKYYIDFQQKIPRTEIDKIKNLMEGILMGIDPLLKFEICGSYRRGNSQSGDIDILITHPNYENIGNHESTGNEKKKNDNNNNKINKKNEKKSKNHLKNIVYLLKKENFVIDSLTENGDTKFMGVCKLNGYDIARRIDIRVVEYKSFYTSVLYFTGNKEFNLYIRNKALEKNYSLSEYCITDLNDNHPIYFNSEEEIFTFLKIPYLNPCERNIT